MLLSEFLENFDFKYRKDDEGYHLIDTTHANLGNIENEVFDSIEMVLDRLDIYYNDTIFEALSKKDLSPVPNMLYDGDEYYPDILDWLDEVCVKDDRFKHYYDLVQCIVNPDLVEEG